MTKRSLVRHFDFWSSGYYPKKVNVYRQVNHIRI